MLNGNLLTNEEKKNLHRLFVIWENFKKIDNNLENEKSWLEYDESHYGRELYSEQKKVIDKTLEMLRPHRQGAWWRYQDEWNRLEKKYS